MEEFKLEKFEKKGRQLRDDPFLSVSTKSILFNRAAYEKYLKEYSYVELYFDKTNLIIGFGLLKRPSDNSFPIRVYRKGHPVVLVNCKVFITSNRIREIVDDIGKKSFRVEEYKQDMLIAKLKARK